MTSPNTEKPHKEELASQISEDSIEKKNDFSSNTSATTSDIPNFGWSQYAERINGRFAMIGFIAILMIETISHSGFLHWAGFVS